ncbi:unnamed protein product [Allacma fusca]|uniref:DM13 domain-containing protein n=1 Tax=Allacma fusca TaxID=39272 RepID=A0A8J2Q6A0_9HEXA|nr:unnamed protein product [Allacma fusca]
MAYRALLLLVIVAVFKAKVQSEEIIWFKPKTFKCEVTIKDSQTFSITNFMTGDAARLGPPSWFVVGNDEEFRFQYIQLSYTAALHNQANECAAIRTDKSAPTEFQLRLPGDLVMANLTYLSIYSPRYFHNFAYYPIPNYPGEPAPDTLRSPVCFWRDFDFD